MTSRTLKLTLSSVLTLALAAGSAFAQEEGEEGMEGAGEAEGAEGGEGEAAAEGGEAGTPEGGDAAMTGTGQMMGPFTKESYPMEVIFRPLTLVKGMIEARAALTILNIKDFDTFIGLGVGAGYGITDKLEVGLSTGLAISPEADWSKSLGIDLKFLVIDQDKLDLAAGFDTSLSFEDGADTFSGFSLSAHTRFLINDKIFVRGGQGLIQFDMISFTDPVSGDESTETGMRLNLNVGGGFQVNPNLAVMLDLGIASIKVFGDVEADTTFFDPLGVTLTGFYAINNKLDAYLMISFPSIADAGDLQMFAVGANYRL